MTYIGNLPPETRAESCHYCGRSFIEAAPRPAYLAPVCLECGTRNTFSDLYKSENGFRPHWELEHWSTDTMRGWIVEYDQRHS